MKVLLSGASGFLGKAILRHIAENTVTTLGRSQADICVDLSKDVPVLNEIDLVIHCAGKAHMIPKSNAEHADFFAVNVNGTDHLLSGLSRMDRLPQAFVLISSVAVYGREVGENINEDAPLLALDSYGRSKILKEQLVLEWCKERNIVCTILRLPLLVGANPPGNLGAMMNGIKKGYYFNIAGGKAKKSMVLVEDVASVIKQAASIGGIFNLTDRYHPNFEELSGFIAKQMGKKKPLNLPMWIAMIIAKVGDLIGNNSPINSNKLNKITSDLTFDDTKAKDILNWNPRRVLEGFNIK